MAEYSVGTYAELVDAINAANASVENDTIAMTADITVTGVLPTLGIRDAQGTVIASGDLTIHGNDHTLSGGGEHRLLFANAGTIAVDSLVLDQGLAKGGDGGDGFVSSGGGGGMGAGGGLYVRQGASVTLTDVTVSNSAAQGGNGGADNNPNSEGTTAGGGGGLGGDGGDSPFFRKWGAGGGAFEGQNGGTAQSEGQAATGGGPYGSTGDGGDFSGGGSAVSSISNRIDQGHNGGYGGGGGGAGTGDKRDNHPTGGDGGFGGGGGGGGGGTSDGNGGGGPGDGGFGGGAGGQLDAGAFGTTLPARAGFGAGEGGTGPGKSAGGGGAAFGAGIFVQEGGSLTIVGNSSVGAGVLTEGNAGAFTGTGNERAPQDGRSAGSSLFLQGSGTLTYAPDAGQSISIDGSIEDQVGFVTRTGYTPPTGTYAGTERWGLTLDGPGTLVLASNTYSGGTTIKNGTLALTQAGAAGSGDITFSAAPTGFAALNVAGTADAGDGQLFANTLVDFGNDDVIDLQALAYTPGASTVVIPPLVGSAPPTLVVFSNGQTRAFTVDGTVASAYAVAKDDADGSTLVGAASTGHVSVTDGATYSSSNDRDIALIDHGAGVNASYVAKTQIVNGHVQVTVDNGTASQTADLGTGRHAVCLDFSTNEAAVALTGGAYGDSLKGGAGNDILDGGRGIDTMDGGAGRDTYIVRDTKDVITEAANGGTDSVKATASYTLAANVERLFLAGIGNIDGTGNGERNYVTGNAGANHIDGKAGADILTGLGGHDTFVFSTTLGAGNIDRVTDFHPNDDLIGLGDSVFRGLAFSGPNGTLASSEFAVLTAQDVTANNKYGENVHIIYRADKGALYYDADGYGGDAKAVAFAVLDGKPALSATDFISHHDIMGS